MKIFHRHSWTVLDGSGFGRAIRFRSCSCGTEETLLFDYSRRKPVWIPGNFMEDRQSPVFVVAETHETLRKALPQLDDMPYMWVRNISDLLLMKTFFRPRFWLADDWKDTSLSDTHEFRVLLMTGHM